MTALKLVGAHGSPYSRKMRSLLRYRHIPYQWILRRSKQDIAIPKMKVDLIPILVFPDGEAMIDSTPMIQRLEKDYSARSVIPADPALAFLDALLEDFADEWLTKAMFHYRWTYKPDIAKASVLLPLAHDPSMPDDQLEQLSKFISERQIGRLGLVGSNEGTGAVIENCYRQLLGAMDEVLHNRPFIMGEKPGASDFGLFGQLAQLVLFEPTSGALALEHSPRLVAWCDNMEDLSGVPDDAVWLTREQAKDALTGLLELCGAYYAPFLLANMEALEAGEQEVHCEVAGQHWQQGAFPYQGKCLQALREAYAALNADDQQFIDGVLAETGCESLFEEI